MIAARSGRRPARLVLLALAALLSGAAWAGTAKVAGLPLPACSVLRDAGLSGEARYPAALAGEASVERLALDAGEIENVAAYLACVAGRSRLDVYVAEQGLALFASRRHGRAALAALDRIARGAGPEAQGARDYGRQIRAYLRGPGR